MPAQANRGEAREAGAAQAGADLPALLHDWAIVLALVVAVLGAGYLRGALLWPQSAGLRESPYDDEGVYVEAAQLMLQGKHPYRDFLYVHPPLGPLMFIPAVEYHFTQWGSPTSFLLARYLAVAYGALTVGLVLLLAWRLWGLGGGILSAALLAIDPSSVWVGRHVMLEGPLLLLGALAALFYVLARAREGTAAGALLAAGFFAAVAGGVKLQGLVVLAAILLDLAARRRWGQVWLVLGGAASLWLALGVYLLVLRGGNPLGQFVWLQLLRPPDGIESGAARLAALARDARLVLLGALLALPALLLLFRPAARRRRRPRRRQPSRVGSMPLRRLPDFADPEAARDAPTSSPIARPPTSPSSPAGSSGREGGLSPASTSVASPPGSGGPGGAAVGPAWSFLVWWAALTLATLLASPTFYAHYAAHLTLPLAILAGALPAGVWSAVRGNAAWRVAGLALVVAAVGGFLITGATALAGDLRSRPDALYEIVGRYAGDAAQPDQAVFALDAQFPFRAARRPAREDQERFVVDGYGMLLYHGLGIEGQSPAALARRVFTQPLADPYVIMWQPAAQEQLKASIERSDLVVIDATSDGRLTDETRRWLATRGKLAEKQERYAIYRITR